MPARRTRRGGRGRAARVLVTTGTAAAVALVAVPGVAVAGGPGVWTAVSDNPPSAGYPRLSLLDEPSVARFGGDLQVVWRAETSATTQDLRTRVLGPGGRALGPVSHVLTGWRGVVETPRLLDLGGSRAVVLAGDPGGLGGFPSGPALAVTSPDGRTWSGSGSRISGTSAAFLGYGFDAVADAGVPVWVGNAQTTGVRWHRGAAGSAVADSEVALPDGWGSAAAAARDQVTGEVYASFFSASESPRVTGIHVLRILPTADSSTRRAPGSASSYTGGVAGRQPDQRIAMASRVGGGVWLAYAQGFPVVTNVRLYEARSGRTLVVPGSAGARDISLAAGPGGTLWVTWVAPDARTLRAVRTDTRVTRFGPIRAIAAPAGHTTMWKTATEGSRGPLDLVVTAQRAGTGKINVFHQQVLPGLTLAFGRTLRVNRAGVRFYALTVADAGRRIAGATVRVGGRAIGTTNATGAIFVAVGKGVRTTLRIGVTRPGYLPATITLRVR